MDFLEEAAIFLGTAIIAVPLFRRFGFGSVLGYLAAGVAIGPWGLGLIDDGENILHFAELGVVFLLFIIGLELQPSRLWVLRKQVFGLGLAQVVVTGAVLTGVGVLLGFDRNLALLVGFGLALSSTAFVLQMLAEKHQLTTLHGRWSFAVLLFQDVAVIPLLALVPLLAPQPATDGGTVSGQLAFSIVLIAVVFASGRILARHVFRAIARWGTEETFTATALLLVIGAALLMESAHISMGLGAFLAGMVLADSEYRHQLEADIAPFKGLLLGLFFIAVGMGANLDLLVSRLWTVLGFTAGLLAVKAAIIFILARLFGLGNGPARHMALILPQGGEFAFVLFTAGLSFGVIAAEELQFAILVVTLSMAATPFLFILNDRVLNPLLGDEKRRPFDELPEQETYIVIAGFGRVGQILGRILTMRGTRFTAIDSSVEQVDIVRRFGNTVYYGEAHRLEILRAAKVDSCTVFVVTIEDPEESLKTVQTVRRHFPNVRIYARARNRFHTLRLMDMGVEYVIRDTILSSLELSRRVLRGMGVEASEADESVDMFAEMDEALLERQQAVQHDETQFIQTTKDAAEELRELFERQANQDVGTKTAKERA